MSPSELEAWAAARTWIHAIKSEPLRYEWNETERLTLCVTDVGYAECRGPDDVVCWLARFSVHGCAGAPTRAEFIRWSKASSRARR